MPNVKVSRDRLVATLVIDRPEKLNALNAQTLDEIDAAMQELGADDGVHAVIVTGAGEKAFVAGADIAELARNSPLTGKESARRGQALLRSIELFPKPVVAAVNGF